LMLPFKPPLMLPLLLPLGEVGVGWITECISWILLMLLPIALPIPLISCSPICSAPSLLPSLKCPRRAPIESLYCPLIES
jgi:hypothetical protein